MRLNDCLFYGLFTSLTVLNSGCASPSPKSETLSLKVGSYNMRITKDRAPNNIKSRAPRIKALLKQEKMDIFGAQEILPEHIRVVSEIPKYHHIGNSRNADRVSGEASTIFYDSEQLECLENHTFWLSETPDKPGSTSWGSACRRICTYGIFRDRKTGTKFVFANTHLDHRSGEAQINGIKLILSRLAGLREKYPFILTGDFNSKPEDQAVVATKKVLNDARSIARKVYPGPIQTYHGYQANPGKRKHNEPIDYIFVNQPIKVLTFRVVDDFHNGLASSDHFLLTSELELPVKK